MSKEKIRIRPEQEDKLKIIKYDNDLKFDWQALDYLIERDKKLKHIETQLLKIEFLLK